MFNNLITKCNDLNCFLDRLQAGNYKIHFETIKIKIT